MHKLQLYDLLICIQSEYTLVGVGDYIVFYHYTPILILEEEQDLIGMLVNNLLPS